MEPKVSPDLKRNQDDTWLFGVASGLADYFGVDATVVRVIFIITAVLGFGSTLLVYLLLAILIHPESDSVAALHQLCGQEKDAVLDSFLNSQFAKMESKPLFSAEGRLNPAITILGA